MFEVQHLEMVEWVWVKAILEWY